MEESIELGISAISACAMWQHDYRTAITSMRFEAVAPEITRIVVRVDKPTAKHPDHAVQDAHESALNELQQFKATVETRQRRSVEPLGRPSVAAQ